jgi:hypothetical protein
MKETPEQPQEAKRPAVGPNKEFAQKVLHGFQEQPLTEEEIKAKQSDWKKYTTDPFEEKKTSSKRLSGILLCRFLDSFIRICYRLSLYQRNHQYHHRLSLQHRWNGAYKCLLEYLRRSQSIDLPKLFYFLNKVESWSNPW